VSTFLALNTEQPTELLYKQTGKQINKQTIQTHKETNGKVIIISIKCLEEDILYIVLLERGE
jgi:hypothetical protein